jgi:spermidine synthase
MFNLNYLLISIAGVLTLAIEMVVSRLLIPYFGSSLYQWAALISIVLLSYSVSYLTFKRVVGKHYTLSIVLAALYVITMPFWVDVILLKLINLPFIPATILSSFIVAAFPSYIWASLLPLLQSRMDQSAGNKILFYSTFGNLLGIFVFTLVVIPSLGVKYSLFLIGAGSLLLLMNTIPKVLGLIPIVLWGSFSVGKTPLAKDVIKHKETIYQNYTLKKKDATILFYINHFLQFEWNPDRPQYDETTYFGLATAAVNWGTGKTLDKQLFVGLGGGLIPWWIKENHPRSVQTAIEIDKEIIQASVKYLPAGQVEDLNIIHDDARYFMSKNKALYNYIMLDAFVGFRVPNHLATQNFFSTVDSHLEPGGIVTINLPSAFDNKFLLNFYTTLKSIFKYTYMIYSEEEEYHFIVASQSNLNLKKRLLSIDGMKAANKFAFDNLITVDETGIVYTDDKDSIDDDTFNGYRFIAKYSKEYAKDINE